MTWPPGVPRILDVAAACVVAVPSMICLLVLDGAPSNWSDLRVWSAPVGLAAAVLISRVHVLISTLMLTAAGVIAVPAANQIFERSPSLWVEYGSLSQLLSVAVVACRLGASLDFLPSLLWFAGSAGLSELFVGGDVPFLIIFLGWWLVGRVLRSREQVAAGLRSRAVELGAERERFVLEAIRLERTKIARELHDVVAHCMTVIVIQARAAQQLLDRDPIAAAEAADIISAVAAEAEADIGALVELMNPERVVPLTRDLLDELVTRAAATGTAVTVQITGDPDSLGPVVAAAAHRTVQEGLTNAFRHAPGAAVHIGLRCTVPITLDVANDAPPVFSPHSLDLSGAGRGLTGLRERLLALGGQLTSGPTSDGGWRISAQFSGSADLERTRIGADSSR